MGPGADPQKEPLPEPKPGDEPWWNQEDAFKEDEEFLKKYTLPKLPKDDLEKN